MPTEHVLSLLIAERDKLNRAIEALQGTTKRRGRPPVNAGVPAAIASVKGRKRGMSAAVRKARSKRMKAYWTKRRKEAAK